MTRSIICPKCHEQTPDDKWYCIRCGAKLKEYPQPTDSSTSSVKKDLPNETLAGNYGEFWAFEHIQRKVLNGDAVRGICLADVEVKDSRQAGDSLLTMLGSLLLLPVLLPLGLLRGLLEPFREIGRFFQGIRKLSAMLIITDKAVYVLNDVLLKKRERAFNYQQIYRLTRNGTAVKKPRFLSAQMILNNPPLEIRCRASRATVPKKCLRYHLMSFRKAAKLL